MLFSAVTRRTERQDAVVLGQITVAEGTTDTTQVRTLLGEMDIAGALVTAARRSPHLRRHRPLPGRGLPGAMLRMALGRQVLPRILHPHSLAHHRPVPRTLRLHQQGPSSLPSQVRRAQRVIPEELIMPIQQVQRR